jgi:hypothetical protein
MKKKNMGFWLRNNSIAVVALCVAIGGTAVVAQAGNDGASSAAKKKAKRGPAGPAGPQGPQGPVGPQGAKGDTGSFGTIVTASSGNINVPANNGNNGTVDCPSAGQVAISGGVNIQGLPAGVFVNASNRSDSNTWTASARNTTGSPANLQIEVYCITPTP